MKKPRPEITKEPKNCCVINGDIKIIISKTTAHYALKAMEEKSLKGGYENLFRDDASFVNAAIEELKKAKQA